jgi:hypothetical protein
MTFPIRGEARAVLTEDSNIDFGGASLFGGFWSGCDHDCLSNALGVMDSIKLNVFEWEIHFAFCGEFIRAK